MTLAAQRLADHPLLSGFAPEQLERIAGCAELRTVEPGVFLAREGQPVDGSWLVLSGRVALEVHAPGHGTRRLETVGAGGTIGWSWMIGSLPWHFDAVVQQRAELVRLDGACLEAQIRRDPAIGLALARRFMALMHRRIERLRLARLDVFAPPGGEEMR